MDIILLRDVESLGYQDDVVTVKSGYGRNYLLPKRLAIVANKANLNARNERVRQTDRKLEKQMSSILAAVERLKGTPIKVKAKVGTTGKIFGSVTNVILADALKQAAGIDIDRRKISILQEVKELGVFKAEVDLHKNVKHEFEFEVVAD